MLDNQVAIVTGTGPNIGLEIARMLAAHGAAVGCLHRRLEMAEQAAHDIQSAGGRAMALQADITRSDDVEHAIANTVSAFGGIHILVNNAGISPYGSLLEHGLDDWRETLDVILTGTFLCSRAVAQRMVEQQQGGVIINVSSTSGHNGRRGAIGYATAKGGLLQMTRVMAMELAPYKIRVNSVSPNSSGLSLGARKSREGTPPVAPLKRWGKTQDQAAAVLFLVSQDADFITGIDLPVDGGFLASYPG